MDGQILLIDGDVKAREQLAGNLRHAGYGVTCSGDLRHAREQASLSKPDLVLVEQPAAGGNTLAFTRQLRADPRTSGVAIIVLGRDPERVQDTVAALECGADDCVARAMSPHEVLARVKAVLRRSAPQCDEQVLEVSGLRFDPAARRVSAYGQDIDLCAIEYRLLRYFMSHPDRILARSRLLDEVWGERVCVEERAVDIHVGRLRRALAPSGHARLIETIRGMGYRLCRDARDDEVRSHADDAQAAAWRVPATVHHANGTGPQ
ncbi:MAG: hypothetical protein RIQ60_2173 [Pseudomonadota bacterium]|jgi:two-component system phosphate regulon response regulator PhoB